MSRNFVVVCVINQSVNSRDGHPKKLEGGTPPDPFEKLGGGTPSGPKKIKVPAGVQPGTKIRLKEQGFPVHGSKDRRGDLYGIVTIEIPKELTQDQKKIIEELKELGL